MGLIDVDELKSNLSWLYDSGCAYVPLDKVKQIVNSIPAVDAVEVVRCKDCKSVCLMTYYHCMYLSKSVLPWDFCSHGERKDKE